MKLLLINPPKDKEAHFATPNGYTKEARSDQPPLGLMYLYSYLHDKIDTSLVDMNVSEEQTEDVLLYINKYQPDLVGITCVISKWATIVDLAKLIKQHSPEIQIVIGGVNPSLYTYETLQCKYIDYAIRGFGQIPLYNLCIKFQKGKLISDIENCFTKDNYKYQVPGSFSFEDIDQYPIPDRKILNPSLYTLAYAPQNPSTSVMSSFGCPHQCHFCQCRTFKPVVIRKTDNVIGELINIESIGIKSVIFQDELFTMSEKRINDVCSTMLSNNINLNWSVRARANHIHIDSLKLMKDSGCFNIHMGIESGSQRILDKMNKKINVSQIRKSIEDINKAGMSCTASFMLGYPTETEEEILQTINFAASNELKSCQFYTTIPSPRTLLYKEWQDRTGYQYDYFSQFTKDPSSIRLDEFIASDIFTKQQMDSFISLGFSKTSNLYQTKERNV